MNPAASRRGSRRSGAEVHANTPWKRDRGQRGGGTSAQSLAMNSTGVTVRQRETRRDDFFIR
jgi:hypothetical protein